MVSQPPSTEVGLVFESPEAGSRVAQLDAEIAQLKDALARRQQIGVATGLPVQRFGDHPEWAWSRLVRVS
jgi:AmiR/NasT family two-component response regulator